MTTAVKFISIKMFLKSTLILCILFIHSLFLFNCQKTTTDDSITNGLIARFLTHRDRIRLIGSVYAPGPVRNVKLYVITLPSIGTCASGSTISTNGKILTEGLTGVAGDFSLAYISEGTPVCIIAVPDTDSTMTIFNTQNKVNTTLTWSGSFSLTAIFTEPKSFNSGSRGVDGVYKFVNITPFTSVLERHFWGLKATQPASSNSDLIALANSNVMKTTFRGLTGLLEENDPTSEKYSIRLNAFAFLADKVTNTADGLINSTDLNSITDYMREDFSDGAYNGKKVDAEGNSINLTPPAVVTSTTTFLTSIFKSAVDTYIDNASLPSPLKDDQIFCNNAASCN